MLLNKIIIPTFFPLCGFDSCRTHFLCEKLKKEEASPQGKNKAMWGEEAKPLKMMLRGSLTSDKNK